VSYTRNWARPWSRDAFRGWASGIGCLLIPVEQTFIGSPTNSAIVSASSEFSNDFRPSKVFDGILPFTDEMSYWLSNASNPPNVDGTCFVLFDFGAVLTLSELRICSRISSNLATNGLPITIAIKLSETGDFTGEEVTAFEGNTLPVAAGGDWQDWMQLTDAVGRYLKFEIHVASYTGNLFTTISEFQFIKLLTTLSRIYPTLPLDHATPGVVINGLVITQADTVKRRVVSPIGKTSGVWCYEVSGLVVSGGNSNGGIGVTYEPEDLSQSDLGAPAGPRGENAWAYYPSGTTANDGFLTGGPELTALGAAMIVADLDAGTISVIVEGDITEYQIAPLNTVPGEYFYPVIASREAGQPLTVNFGETPFVNAVPARCHNGWFTEKSGDC